MIKDLRVEERIIYCDFNAIYRAVSFIIRYLIHIRLTRTNNGRPVSLVFMS